MLYPQEQDEFDNLVLRFAEWRQREFPPGWAGHDVEGAANC